MKAKKRQPRCGSIREYTSILWVFNSDSAMHFGGLNMNKEQQLHWLKKRVRK